MISRIATIGTKITTQIVAVAAVLGAFVADAAGREMSSPQTDESLLSRFTIEVPLFTRHVLQDEGFNDHNWGALVEMALSPRWSVVVGDFRNSYYRDTEIAAFRYSFYIWQFSVVKIDTGFMLGFDLNGGYKDHSDVDPLLGALSIKISGDHFSEWELLDKTGIAFTVIPGRTTAINVGLTLGL
jgi:hypothetical protein